jgi:hypothetical protein
MNIQQAKAIAAEYGINAKSRPFLLSKPDANPKTGKNLKFGILTSPLHLAPARLSGYEVCPQRSKGCSAACLHTAGNPAYMVGKARARIAKTKLYFEQREAFLTLLLEDIFWLSLRANKQGLKAGVRLNATSDVPWERVKLDGESVIDYCSRLGVAVYDYTKIKKRAIANPYDLTFSRTESNDSDCIGVLKAGGNVAVVFEKALPESWHGFPVIDGDESDWRPGDPRGVIVGLKAKGLARNDDTGFVVRTKAQSACYPT